MISRRHFLPLCAALFLGLLAACGGAKQAEVAKTIDDRFPIKIGERVVQVQVAILPGEQQRGLMYRTTMGADEGMIFVFDTPQKMSFWMRNTELPLDIGYITTEGELKEVYPMYPHDERPVRSRTTVQLALEMNQGWFARSGVKPGAKLDLAALREAIRARGFKPEALGLR